MTPDELTGPPTKPRGDPPSLVARPARRLLRG